MRQNKQATFKLSYHHLGRKKIWSAIKKPQTKTLMMSHRLFLRGGGGKVFAPFHQCYMKTTRKNYSNKRNFSTKIYFCIKVRGRRTPWSTEIRLNFFFRFTPLRWALFFLCVRSRNENAYKKILEIFIANSSWIQIFKITLKHTVMCEMRRGKGRRQDCFGKKDAAVYGEQCEKYCNEKIGLYILSPKRFI
jgi:hypothetical protein